MKYTAVFNSDTDKGCAGKRSRDKVFAIILSLSFLHTLQKVRISLCTRVTAATQEGKGGGEGKDRGVLKLEREMKADFSPFSLLKKKKKKRIPTLWSHPGKHLRRRRALI